MTDLAELVNAHALLTMDKQLRAADVIGERDWHADLDTGTIEFGDDIEMRAGLVGTESLEAGSWLWAWANEGGFDEQVIAGALRLRELGADQAIAEFTEPELPLSEQISATRIAFATVGVLQARAYYSAPVAATTRAILLLDHPELELPEPEALRIVSAVTALVQAGEVDDWPAALAAYGAQRGVALSADAAGERFQLGDVEIVLDELGRVTSIAGEAAPAPPRGRAQRRGLFGRRRRR